MLRGRSRFGVRADRDVVYSFSESLSYYVQTSFALNVVIQVTERSPPLLVRSTAAAIS